MGSGASTNKPTKPKQENLQQPLSTQNRTDITQTDATASYSSADSSRKLLTPIEPPIKQNQIQSIHNSQVPVRTSSPQVQNRSPSVPNEATNGRKIKILSDGTEPPVSFYQQNDNRDDNDEVQLVPINNFQKRSNRSSLNSNPVTRLPSVNSKTSTKRRTSVDAKSSTSLTGQIGHCAFCPHCKHLPRIINTKSTEPQPVWITEPRPNTYQHIIMDDYDEEAVRKKIISEHGHLPGSYDYSPNLTIEEKKDQNEISKKYLRLPIITKAGSPMSPIRTPFPDYDILQRREKHLNKPYTSTLFTD